MQHNRRDSVHMGGCLVRGMDKRVSYLRCVERKQQILLELRLRDKNWLPESLDFLNEDEGFNSVEWAQTPGGAWRIHWKGRRA